MAHHQSAKKRIRQDAAKRLRNRYYKKSTRTAIKNLKEMTSKSDAQKFLPKVISMIDNSTLSRLLLLQYLVITD